MKTKKKQKKQTGTNKHHKENTMYDDAQAKAKLC